jgi:hypothetical protein
MSNITTNDRAFFALPLIDKMSAIIFTQYNLSESRAVRQMAEAQAPSILTAGVILLHSMRATSNGGWTSCAVTMTLVTQPPRSS